MYRDTSSVDCAPRELTHACSRSDTKLVIYGMPCDYTVCLTTQQISPKIWEHALAPPFTNLGHDPVTYHYLDILYLKLKIVDPNMNLS